ncbi:MAG: YihY/virulence factor BrkB family protein [Lachnospiraceae bacterium]|nr:YihY/virulence factor BrkB family protein [Lachnospiraceae bacterium]MDD3795351.1 YihY/virulence factor BrkB family protein [Lachnospiraceae bacterium]
MKTKNKIIQLIFTFQKKIKYDRIDVYAAQASFYCIMSAVPVLMLLFTLLQYTPLSQENVMEVLSNILNAGMMETVNEVVENVYRGSVTLVSFAAVSLLWVAGKMMIGLTNGLNNIHKLSENRNYFLLRFRASFYTVLMVAALILAIMILVFGFRFQSFLSSIFPLLAKMEKLMIYLQTLIALCLITVIFNSLYVFLPNRKRRYFSQFPGAIFATLSWCTFSYFFNIYLSYAKNMSVIYGGLVTLVVAMLWLYFCMYLWFLGAEINAYLENKASFDVTL